MKLKQWILVSFLALPLFASAEPVGELCSHWTVCSCNKYNIYLENQSDKPWTVTQIALSHGEQGNFDTAIQPGEVGFIGSYNGKYKFAGSSLIATLTNGKKIVTIHGEQKYCGFSAGEVNAYSSDSTIIENTENEIGSFKDSQPGFSFFVIH